MTAKRGAHIQIDGVSHRYRARDNLVLRDIDIEIQPGEIVAVVGRSGCGKSTLLHILSGLTKNRDGGVYVDGRRVDGPSPNLVMMFQQPSLYPWMSVFQNASLSLRFTGRKDGAREKVAALLDLVQLPEYIDTNVQQLSGGQQQRVALARSLAPEPAVLLLDEPFSALDTFTRRDLQTVVRTIVRDLGITMVLVTHDIDEAVTMADRAIVMDAHPGRIRGEVPIDLTATSYGGTAAFDAARDAVLEVFEATVGDPDRLDEPDEDANDRAEPRQAIRSVNAA
jgi:NitT/TauT family transport system ATP-binding protein